MSLVIYQCTSNQLPSVQRVFLWLILVWYKSEVEINTTNMSKMLNV